MPVEKGRIEQRPSVIVEQPVVGHLARRTTFALCGRGDRVGRIRLVVGNVAEPEHLAEGFDGVAAQHAIRVDIHLFDDRATHRRLAHADHALRKRQVGNRLVGRAVHEGVQRQIEAGHDANRSRGHLGTQGQAALAAAGQPVEDHAPLLGLGMVLCD